MSVSVSNGSLNFVSTLDNSDFQTKSLEDLRLIKLRLELTGDTSGITKYDEAVKSALATETKLRNDLAKILEDAKIATKEFTDQVQQTPSKTVFSDSAAEVQLYVDSLAGLQSGADTVALLNAQLDELAIKQNELTATFEAGKITEAQYNSQLETINTEQSRLVQNIQQVNDMYADNILIQNENVASTEKTIASVQEEIGVLEELTITLAELKAAKFGASSENLPIINRQIQETEAEIKKFSNTGKVGFDAFGNALTQAEPKAGKLASTVSRLTNIQNIASRVLTQFTRQIIGLGVGFISLEIGAKAIQGLIEYISNLDVFTGRLDVAKQSLLAFNEVQQEADKSAGATISSFKILSDAATDVSASMESRVAAAQKLKQLAPDELATTSALAIVNGQLKDSYDEITQAILNNAKAVSINSKLADITTKTLDADLQIQKIKNAQFNQLSRVTAPTEEEIQAEARSGGGSNSSLQDRINFINKQANDAIDAQNKTKTVLTATANFLTTFAKQNNINLAGALEGLNNIIKEPLTRFNQIIAAISDKNDLVALQKALQDKLDSLTPSDAQFSDIKAKLKQVDDLLKKYQVKASPTTDPAIAAGQSLLASQTALLEKIDALRTKYATKDKTRNEQAIDDITATFTAQVNAINAANKKYDDFVAKFGQKAANKAGLIRLDPTSLQSTQQDALAGLAGQQSVDATKQQIDTEKQLYADYEAFKLKAGTQAANELYGVQIGSFKSYVDYLKSLQPTVDELNSPDPFVKARASKLADLLKTEIATANNEELKQQQQHLEELLTQNESYVQQRNSLIEKSIEDSQALTDAGDLQGAAQNDKALQDQLTALDEANFKKLKLYKDLFDGVKNLSTKQAQDDIDALEAKALDDLNNSRITTDAFNDIMKQLTAASTALKATGTPQTLLEIGAAFATLGTEIGKVNTNLGAIISGAGNALTSISKISQLQSEIADKTTKQTVKTKDQIDLYVTAASAVISVLNDISEASAARQKAEQDYYTNIIDFQHQYNLALIQQQQIQFQTNGNIFETDFAKELADGAIAYTQATAAYKTALTNLTQGQAIVGTKNVVNGKSVISGAASGAAIGATIASVAGPLTALGGAIVGGLIGAIGGLFGGKTPAPKLEPLLQAFPTLIDSTGKFNEALAKSLIATNQVTDATKVLLQNTIDYYDQAQSAIDQINSALQTLSGNLASDLDNALVTAFENGSDAAKAFGDTVSGVIGNIIQQFLFQDIFDSQFTALNKKLQATVLGGGSSGDITKDFLDFFKDAGPLVKQFEDALKAAQVAGSTEGLTLFQPTGASAPQTASGAIQAALTENTAEIIEGTMKGIQLNTFQTNLILQGHSLSFGQMISIAQDHLTTALQIQVNTKRTADNSDALPDMLDALKSIVTNTASSAATELRAAGKFGY